MIYASWGNSNELKRVDRKNNYHNSGIHYCGIWHHISYVRRIWRRNPCCIVAGNIRDISYKHRYGLDDSSDHNDIVCFFL